MPPVTLALLLQRKVLLLPHPNAAPASTRSSSSRLGGAIVSVLEGLLQQGRRLQQRAPFAPPSHVQEGEEGGGATRTTNKGNSSSLGISTVTTADSRGRGGSSWIQAWEGFRGGDNGTVVSSHSPTPTRRLWHGRGGGG